MTSLLFRYRQITANIMMSLLSKLKHCADAESVVCVSTCGRTSCITTPYCHLLLNGGTAVRLKLKKKKRLSGSVHSVSFVRDSRAQCCCSGSLISHSQHSFILKLGERNCSVSEAIWTFNPWLFTCCTAKKKKKSRKHWQTAPNCACRLIPYSISTCKE